MKLCPKTTYSETSIASKARKRLLSDFVKFKTNKNTVTVKRNFFLLIISSEFRYHLMMPDSRANKNTAHSIWYKLSVNTYTPYCDTVKFRVIIGSRINPISLEDTLLNP